MTHYIDLLRSNLSSMTKGFNWSAKLFMSSPTASWPDGARTLNSTRWDPVTGSRLSTADPIILYTLLTVTFILPFLNIDPLHINSYSSLQNVYFFFIGNIESTSTYIYSKSVPNQPSVKLFVLLLNLKRLKTNQHPNILIVTVTSLWNDINCKATDARTALTSTDLHPSSVRNSTTLLLQAMS